MTDIPVKNDRPEIIRKSISTYDPIVSDLENKDINIDLHLHEKTPLQICIIRDYVENSILFANLDDEQFDTLIQVLDSATYEGDNFVFKMNETANKFYIVRSGSFRACDSHNGNIREYYQGDLICEQAMLYPYTHKFNLKAIKLSSLWFVDRQTFRRVKLTLIARKRKLCETYLATVPIFRQLHTNDFINLADCLESMSFKKGDFVYKQQSPSDGLYIVEKGSVHLCSMDDSGKQIIVYTVIKGGHFGERSMITCSPRKTSAIAATDILVSFLRVAAFERLKGFCKDIAREEEINEVFGSGVDIFTKRQL